MTLPNFPPGQGPTEPKRVGNPERRQVFFEEIVRRKRAELDKAIPAATIDVQVSDDEPDEE